MQRHQQSKILWDKYCKQCLKPRIEIHKNNCNNQQIRFEEQSILEDKIGSIHHQVKKNQAYIVDIQD